MIQRIEKIILDSPRQLNEEFHATKNSRLACLKTRISTIMIYLDEEAKNELGDEKYEHAREKLKFLTDEVKRLEDIYPSKNTTPPSEEQQKLFGMLDVLK